MILKISLTGIVVYLDNLAKKKGYLPHLMKLFRFKSKMCKKEGWMVITDRLDYFLFFVSLIAITIPTVILVKNCFDHLALPDNTNLQNL